MRRVDPTGVTVVADVPSPHQNVFFDALARAPEVDLEVLFCRRTMPGRAWSGEGPKVARHRFLPVVTAAGVPVNPTLPAALLAQPKRLPFLIGYYLPGLLAAGAALTALRRRWVFWTDTLPPKDAPAPLPRRLLRDGARALFLRGSTLCVSTGEAGRQALLAHGVPDSRARVVPFVVDVDAIRAAVAREQPGRAALRAQHGAAPGDRVLLFVGQLVERKGVDLLLEALAAQAGTSARLWAVGEGPERAALGARAQALGLQERVTFLPYRPNDALPALWAAADLFVLPSRFDAWPVVVLEALAAGLPVLGTDACGSVRDLVVPARAGFCARAGDAGALADALREALALPEEGLQALRRAARGAGDLVSPQHAVKRFLEVVREARGGA